MKKIFFFLFWLLSVPLLAQVNHGGTPESFSLSPSEMETAKTFRYEFSQSEIVDATSYSLPIGVTEKVQIDMWQQGTKAILKNGKLILRLKVKVNNCPSVGLAFSEFWMPEGAELFAYDETQRIRLGAFTHLNNKESGKFVIQSIPKDHMILEYNAPASLLESPKLVIDRIRKVYRDDHGNPLGAEGRDDSCYEDIHCKPNIEVERSVMSWRYMDGDGDLFVCSCNMIDQDVPINDIRPMVLTANHCGNDADLATALFRFNFQNTDCGTNDANMFNFTQVGASKLAKRWLFDMFLMELDAFPPADFNYHMAGWDRSSNGDLTDDMMGISHPHDRWKEKMNG